MGLLSRIQEETVLDHSSQVHVPTKTKTESKDRAKKIVEEKKQKRGGHTWENKQTNKNRGREFRKMRIN